MGVIVCGEHKKEKKNVQTQYAVTAAAAPTSVLAEYCCFLHELWAIIESEVYFFFVVHTKKKNYSNLILIETLLHNIITLHKIHVKCKNNTVVNNLFNLILY